MSLMFLAVSLPAISYYLYRDEEKPEPIPDKKCPAVKCLPVTGCDTDCDDPFHSFSDPVFILPTPEQLLVVLPFYPVGEWDTIDGVGSPWGVCGAREDGYHQVCRIDTANLTRLGRSVLRLIEKSRE